MEAFESLKATRLQNEEEVKEREALICKVDGCDANNDPQSPCKGCSELYCTEHLHDHQCANSVRPPKGQQKIVTFLSTTKCAVSSCLTSGESAKFVCQCSKNIFYCGQHVLQDMHGCALLASSTKTPMKKGSTSETTLSLNTPAATVSAPGGATVGGKRKALGVDEVSPSGKRPSRRKYCFAHGYDKHDGRECATLKNEKYTHRMRDATEHCTLPTKVSNKSMNGCEDNLVPYCLCCGWEGEHMGIDCPEMKDNDRYPNAAREAGQPVYNIHKTGDGNAMDPCRRGAAKLKAHGRMWNEKQRRIEVVQK